MREFPQLNTRDYREIYKEFVKIRTLLLQDKELEKEIKSSPPEKKMQIIKEKLGIIIKKRHTNRAKDIYPWELSHLIGSTEYIVPSFPVEIGGKIVIIQKLEKFDIGSNLLGYDKKIAAKVSLKDYWMALLQAYLFGISDLVAQNIGVNKQGMIRFFDIESCLNYNNIPRKEQISPDLTIVKMGFQCQGIDWAQCRRPLDKKTAQQIQRFIRSFIDDFETTFTSYLAYRPTPYFEEGLQERIAVLKNYPFEEGTTFEDFFYLIYPHMSPGLNKLSRIVTDILGVQTGEATAMFFLSRKIKRTPLTSKQKEALNQWTTRYID